MTRTMPSWSDWLLFAVRAAVVGLQGAIFLLLAWLLEPDAFGRFLFAVAVARIAGAAAALGIGGYMLRELAARPVRGDAPFALPTFLVATFGLPLAGALAAVAAASLASPFVAAFADAETGSGRMLMAIGVLGYAFAATAIVGSAVRVGAGALPGMAVQLALPFVAMLLAVLPVVLGGGADVAGIVLLTGLILAAGLALALGFVLRAGALHVAGRRGGPPARGLGEIVRGAMPYWGSSLVIALATQVDLIIAGMLLGAADLGAYGLIRHVANLVSLPRIIADWAVAPAVARGWAAGDRAALGSVVRRSRMLALLPAVGVALVIVLSAPLWFRLYDVPAAGAWPALVLAILLAANLAQAGLGLAMVFASQCGLEHVNLVARSVALAAGAGVAVGLGMLAGPAGIAAGSLVMALSLGLAMVHFVRRRTGVATI